MRILIVAATAPEIAPLVGKFHRTSDVGPRTTRYTHVGHDLVVVTTDVGMVATAAWCSRLLTTESCSLALNFGVCGSFDRSLEPGTVVHVVADRIAELGAEDGDTFLTVEELMLPAGHQFVNAARPINVALSRLPAVSGITVNTIHGNERSIAAVVQRFNPQVESMEGAAFMYSCLTHDIPFAQVRAVSNMVEKRNRQAWKMTEAIDNLGAAAMRIIEHV
jgi:futalosine hydrolase